MFMVISEFRVNCTMKTVFNLQLVCVTFLVNPFFSFYL